MLLFSALSGFAQDNLPWSDGFETWLDAKWTTSGSAVTQATVAQSGSYAALINSNDWMYLTLNLAPYSTSTDVALSFYYRNSVTWEPGDYLYVEMNNGAGWLQIHSEHGDQSTYLPIVLDLDAAGALVNSYQIRFRVSSNNPNEDAYIDNVVITGSTTIKRWGGGGSNSNWSTAANWEGNTVPAAGDSVVFDGTSTKNCLLDVAATVKTFTITPDYSGDLNFTTNSLSITGNAYLLPGGSITAGSGSLQFTGTAPQTFTPADGQSLPAIIQNGSGGTTIVSNNLTTQAMVITSGILHLGEGLLHSVGTVTAGGGTLDFGSSILQATDNVSLNSGAFTVIGGSGQLLFTGQSVQTFTPKAGGIHPEIGHIGTGTLAIAGDLICGNFTQSAGVLDVKGFNITVNGNLRVVNGTTTTFLGLGNNLLITVSGTASLNGQASSLLNLDGGTWRIFMSTDGLLSAMYARINFSTVTSALPNGDAIECVNGGSNAGWTFTTENYATWSYYKKIYVNTTASGANVSGNVAKFPLLVRLNAGNIDFGQVVGAAGQDLRFAKADGIHMNYQIENWSDGVAAEVWVMVDTVYGNNKNQFFYMYWGKSGVTDRSNGATVFPVANNFIGVYHLAEVGNTVANGYLSATGANNGTGYAMTTSSKTTAVVGSGSSFIAGSKQYLSTADAPFDLADNVTMSTWMQTSDATLVWARVIDKFSRATGYGIGGNNGIYGFVAYWTVSGWGGDPSVTFEPLGDATWYYVTATVSGGVAKSYRNGQLVSTFSGYSGHGLTTNNNPLTIGKSANSKNYWTGTLDEVRIENAPRSGDWIKLCYETQRPGANVLFSPKTWDGGGADTRWSTAANWTDDNVPTAADDVLFYNISIKNCLLDTSVTIKSITFTSGYLGTFSFAAAKNLTVTGNADFSSGGTIDAATGSGLTFAGTTPQVFVPKTGATFPAITQSGAGGTMVSSSGLAADVLTITAGIFNMGTNLSHSFTAISGSGGGINYSSATVLVRGDVTLSTVSCTAGSGVLNFAGSAHQVVSPSTVMPAVLHTSANRLQLTAPLNCVRFTQSAGSFDFNGNNMSVSGNFTLSSGTDTSFVNLGGRQITVGGSASLAGSTGSLLNCDPATAWSISVAGNLTASYAAINRSTATQSNGSASSTCTNGGIGVIGWSFDTDDYATWTYNSNVYLNTTTTGANVSGTVSNFPVLLRLSSANYDFSQAMTNGEDIRFATTGLTPLSYQIEAWNLAGQTAALWVNVPVIYGNNKTQCIKMYWGKTGSVSKSSSNSVFTTAGGTMAVWHLNGNLADATSNGITLADVGSVNSAALIADGRSFTGVANVNIPASTTLNALTAMTMSGWARTVDNALNQTLFSYYYNASNYTYLRYDITDGIVVKNWINSTNSGWQIITNYVPANNTWFHVAWVMDGTTWKVYINGVLSASAAQTMTMNSIPDNFYGSIAAERTGSASYGSRWKGLTDEVCIADMARDSTWIKLCYETQKTGADCVYLSDAPIVTGPSGQGNVTGIQYHKDSVMVAYQVSDPNSANVTISMQVCPSGGNWIDAGSTSGQIGTAISAVSASTNRQINWGVRAQLGSAVEGYFFTRVIADDGMHRDTTASDSFFVDTRAPSGVTDLALEGVAGTTVSLSWTTATDARFGHYEIWYGTDPAKVDLRDTAAPAGATEWDGADDARMNERTTGSTLIAGLTTSTTYYFKLFAADLFNNESTLPAHLVYIPSRVEPVWTAATLGDINGGAITEGDIYIGCGANAYAIEKIDLTDGTKKWDYSTFPDACNMPTYNYYNGYYHIVASAGDNIIGIRDDGGSNKSQLFPKQTIGAGTAPGNPYISTEDSCFYVAYTDKIDKRNLSNGLSAGAPWPMALANISTAADIVVFNDEVYVATTTGLIYKVSFNGVLSGPFNVGAGVYQPLMVIGGNLYIAPSNNTLFKIRTSTLDTTGGTGWVFTLTAANTGPVFVNGASLYAACGNYIQKIQDNGSSAASLWISNAMNGTVTSGPIPYNGFVFAGRNGGEFHALDDANGMEIPGGWPYTGANGDSDVGPWIDDIRQNVLFSTAGGELRSFRVVK